ncbi:MAG: hypothetical protein CMQ15_16155 [Gammaproteobacteria bacterium]|jgi:radical SAM superfamily enzyme YgiQ (UPF0313 family)|nr:hypothetical protein [Gammaproteobacteria bacterium]|tara:strand:- start:356 stop:2383 length:2028 start_codon:yes stop_codon:yes gene_type:complete
MNLPIKISFSDLKHDKHSCNAIPIGISRVAAYTLKKIGKKIDIKLFKHPVEFQKYLERNTPRIACFSNYIWNLKISYEFASRIKRKTPETIIVFGGPNYPLEEEERKKFFHSFPLIDFYIINDGEMAFVELLEKLFEADFHVNHIKGKKKKISNCHYINEDFFFSGDILPRKKNLDEFPSPFLTGLLDHFFDGKLFPVLETTRGCPFKCSFCDEGQPYYNGISRFSLERIKNELEFIAKKNKSTDLLLADSNFGMYKEDLEVCKLISLMQEKYGWPKNFRGIGGKNKKDRVLKAASLVQRSFLGAAVQSTDEQVLRNISRENISLDQMINVVKEGEKYGGNSFSEVILCLPGDSKESHINSIVELIDLGMNVVRSHQLIMLPGSEVSKKESREKYGMITKFRVVPDTVEPNQLYGDTFFAPEIDEICVGNNVMPYKDYLECRLLNFTVEVFYNDGIFQELFKFLNLYDISISSLILDIHSSIENNSSQLSKLYDDFLRETNQLWDSKEELEHSLKQPDIFKRYESQKFGVNEQLMYRAKAIFEHMEELHGIVFKVAKEIFREKDCFNEKIDNYLGELLEFSLMWKKDIFSYNSVATKKFRYDFIRLAEKNFNCEPFSFLNPEGINIEFAHSSEQKTIIQHYINHYGLSLSGFGHILGQGHHISKLFRSVRKTNNP